MAIKALEDALREKDQAMERERDRFNKELDGERKKRNDLEIQVNNPEEGKIQSFNENLRVVISTLQFHETIIFC